MDSSVVRAIWKRDRTGALLVLFGAAAILAGASLGFLVDFAKVRTPYAGAIPHAINVLCVAFFLAREYAARGARVAATERQFEAAFEHSPIGKALLRTDGRFLRVNRAFCNIVGSTAEELRGRRLYDIFHDDDEGSLEFRQLFEGEGRTYSLERRLVRKEGDPGWALLVVSVVPDDHGRAVQMIAHVQDVTELRAHRQGLEELVATRTRQLSAAKDEAERANRAKSEFLAHISHEIRNPLHVMLLCAQILERDPTLGGSQQTQVGILRSSGNHLLALMNDLLEMAKLEARRPELVEDRFDPRATLDEVERMFAGEAAAKGIEIEIACEAGFPRAILGDGGKVKQILINLAGNALKFTERGTIRFEASASAIADGAAGADGLCVKIVVADTGIGIAKSDTARIFQPFEQLDAGKRAGGTGLGLAISLGHARLMGGDLTVESAPGIGSTFTFTFVAKKRRPGGVARRPRADPPGRGRRDEIEGAHRRRRVRQPRGPLGAALGPPLRDAHGGGRTGRPLEPRSLAPGPRARRPAHARDGRARGHPTSEGLRVSRGDRSAQRRRARRTTNGRRWPSAPTSSSVSPSTTAS